MRHLQKLFLLIALLASFSAGANTFTVNNTNDWFFGSLRWAIEDANKNPGHDTIRFAIGSGPKTIRLNSELPQITDPVTIDGWSQPGWSGNPIIELDGRNVAGVGLIISKTSTIRGLVINRFGYSGIGIGHYAAGSNADGTVIHGCWIGVGLDGNATAPNGRDGIRIYANDVVIGGGGPNERNVISYNGKSGINIGSHWGTGQSSGGIGHRTRVQGNHIGVDAAGTFSRGNSVHGIEIFAGTDIVIGGDTPALGNIISGNGSNGILVRDFPSFDGTTHYVIRTTIKNNKIGVGADNSPMGNGYFGTEEVAGVRIWAPESTIAQNVIANNNGAAIHVRGKSGHRITNNSIYNNVGLGIDLGTQWYDVGVTPNDFNDADSGGNGFLNYPVLTYALNEQSHTRIVGTYQGAANTALTLEFFESTGCDSSGHGEGQRFVGTGSIMTNATGGATFTVNITPQVPLGRNITATATDSLGNTSEFSACRAIVAGLPPVITGFTPQGGRIGTYITISGSGFTWVNSIKVNGVTANVYRYNDTTLGTNIPDGATTGPITVSGPYGSATSTASFRVTPRAGDMTGDGRPDLLWRNYTNGYNTLWVTGSQNVPMLGVTDPQWQMQGTGDFNNDGRHDIVWRHYGSGANTLWLMNSPNGIDHTNNWLVSVTNLNWHIDAVGDFDNDGDPDLVARDHATGEGWIYVMDGVTWTGWRQGLETIPVEWQIEAAGDFNLDGSTDLLWRNYTNGQVSIWFMNGLYWFGDYTLLPSVADANWMIEGASDWDQDGDLDIIWRNPATGQNSVWFLNAAYWDGTSYVLLPSVTDGQERIEDY